MRNVRGIDAWEFVLVRGAATAFRLVERCHPDDRAALSDALERCAAGESDELDVDCRLLDEDGTYRWSLQRGSVTQRVDDGTARLAGASIDVEDRVAREEALRRTKERAEAENRAKDDLLA